MATKKSISTTVTTLRPDDLGWRLGSDLLDQIGTLRLVHHVLDAAENRGQLAGDDLSAVRSQVGRVLADLDAIHNRLGDLSLRGRESERAA